MPKANVRLSGHGQPRTVYTPSTAIVAVSAWPTSVGWCLPGPPGLALWARTPGDGAWAAPNRCYASARSISARTSASASVDSRATSAARARSATTSA